MNSKELFKNYIYPIATFSGGMLGVGFLSLPYVAFKAGWAVMLGYFILCASIVVAINLVFSEVSLKTPDRKRFPGFVGYHLGKWAGGISLVSTISVTFCVLLVYLIVSGDFISELIKPAISLSPQLCALIFFAAAAAIIFFGIKTISRLELWVITFLFFAVVATFWGGINYFKSSHIALSGLNSGLGAFLLPYGPILFSLWGIGLIPQAEEMVKGRKSSLKKIIIISTLITVVFYVLFTFAILGITGGYTRETALSGLKFFVPAPIFSIALLAGIFSVFVAFVMQGNILRDVLAFDMGIKKSHAFIIACLTPLVLFLSGIRSFIPLISFVGAVLLGIDGIMILAMYRKINGKKKWAYFLAGIFAFGIFYEAMKFLK